jgi:hypothetical protein
MELGNIIFGNSRGQFEIERGKGFEEELIRLFESYAPERDSSWREYGEEFENDIFMVEPYYWGECTCGFDSKEFNEEHSKECYQTELKNEKLKAGWIYDKDGYSKRPKEWTYEDEDKKERFIYKELCKKYKLSYPSGCAVHCTCDYDERAQKWLNKIGYPTGHKKECLLEKPNFLYKPTGFEIQWYKYCLRDSYSNQPITLKKFKSIIDDCIKSLTTK